MSRQCPSCRTIVDFSSAKCTECGLKFFSPAGRRSSFSATCLRIGSWAVGMAVVTLAVMRFVN